MCCQVQAYVLSRYLKHTKTENGIWAINEELYAEVSPAQPRNNISNTNILPPSSLARPSRQAKGKLLADKKSGIEMEKPHRAAPRKGMQVGKVSQDLAPGRAPNSKLHSQPSSLETQKGDLGPLFSATEMQPRELEPPGQVSRAGRLP
jgi:hypothetical protein